MIQFWKRIQKNVYANADIPNRRELVKCISDMNTEKAVKTLACIISNKEDSTIRMSKHELKKMFKKRTN